MNIFSMDQLIRELRRLSNEEETGTLYIVTDDRHAGFFTLQEGRIINVFFKGCRGEKALEQIKSSIIPGTSLRFENRITKMNPIPLPSNELIFTQLLEPANDIPGNSKPNTKSNNSATHQPNSISNFNISADQKSQIQQKLAKYVGPVADRVIDDALDNSSDTAEFMQLLYQKHS